MRDIKLSGKKNPGHSKLLLIFKLLSYWPLFLSLFAVSLIGSWIYLQFIPTLYQANARILIHEIKGNEELKVDAYRSATSSVHASDNERKIFMPKPILEKVASNLALYAPVYQRKGLKSVSLYRTAPVKIFVKNLKDLAPKGKVKFTCSVLSVNIDGKKYPYNKWLKMPYGTLMFKLNSNNGELHEGVFLFALLPPKKIVNSISGSIHVTEGNQSSAILNLSLLDSDPYRAEDILNSITNIYSGDGIDERNRLAANTKIYINSRLSSVENALLKIESKLQNYHADFGPADVSKKGKLYEENVSRNDRQVGEISMRLSVLNQVEKFVKSGDLDVGINPSTTGISNRELTRMVKDMYQLRLNTENLRKITGETGPVIASYVSQINKIKLLIFRNLARLRSNFSSSRDSLEHEIFNYSSALRSMPEAEQKLIDINRQQQIIRGVYTFLLEKKEETELSYITSGPESKVVNRIESHAFPLGSGKRTIYLVSLLGAVIFGIGFVSLKENMSRNVISEDDIRMRTSLQVIGQITSDASARKLVTGFQAKTPIGKQFGDLGTALYRMVPDKKNKRLMVTSAVLGEGKSFVASNLAISLALSGKKVVLLDFDLHHPSLQDKFNIRQATGITDFMEGATSRVKDIIHPSGTYDKLFLLLTGKSPVNPAKLVLKDKAEALLDYLAVEFDFIILDVPISSDTNVYALAPLCDATFFIVRRGYTAKAFVEQIDENIRLYKIKNPAIVFNALT